MEGLYERGHSQETSKIFLATPIIPGAGKSTDFKFCTHIYRVDRNKSP